MNQSDVRKTGYIQQWSKVASSPFSLGIRRLVADQTSQKQASGPGDRQGEGNRPNSCNYSDKRTDHQPLG